MSGLSQTVIYHNPNCSTSRKVLGLLREAGHEPRIIEYLKTPPDRPELESLLKRMGAAPRDILRRKGSPYDELGLKDLSLPDEALIDAMLRHPTLIERPIVVTSRGAALCRPAEAVMPLLG